jgi:hypothetical protein
VCKTDKPSNESFLGSTGLNIVIDDPEFVVEVASSVIGADLIQLLTEQNRIEWVRALPSLMHLGLKTGPLCPIL